MMRAHDLEWHLVSMMCLHPVQGSLAAARAPVEAPPGEFVRPGSTAVFITIPPCALPAPTPFANIMTS